MVFCATFVRPRPVIWLWINVTFTELQIYLELQTRIYRREIYFHKA